MDPSGFRATIEVSGSEGILEFDSRQNPVFRTHTDSGSRSESQMASTDDPYFKQLSRFIRAVQEGSPVPVDGREGLKAVAIAEAAIESAQTGRPVAPVT
jgi:predicted dehydrogenase